MRKIRKLYYFDKKSALEMISFLNNGAIDNYINNIMFNPFILFHHILPLKLKYLPESFVLKNEDGLKGLITVAPNKAVEKRVEIKKLFFEENAYEDAAELVQYAVSKYKAMGAISVQVKVDNYLPELLSMFVSKCGFSQISYEKIWRITESPKMEYDKKEFRNFRNSDASTLTNMYNDILLPHFRPLLGAEIGEFKENLFKGLSYYSEYKYVIQDKKSGNTVGCVSVQTSDNKNYIVDIIHSDWIDCDINEILSFAYDKIKQRNKNFGMFLRTKRYLTIGEKHEQICAQKGYECVQNQVVLTNTSLRALTSKEKTGRYTVLSDFCPSNIMTTKNTTRS